MTPLMCTSNTLHHVDYGIPLLALKSTDYRTSTGKNHSFHPEIPQQFDCREKLICHRDVLDRDICIRDDVKSEYTKSFEEKQNYLEVASKMGRALQCDGVDYIRNVQEKLYQRSFNPLKPGISEMKDCYRTKRRFQDEEVAAPASALKCQIQSLDKPLQPLIPPKEKSYWKHLDIYMTDNRMKYGPYNEDQMSRSREDCVTYYSAAGIYKNATLPAPSTGNKSVYDRITFRIQYPNKFLSRAPRRVPNCGMQSEYGGRYKSQSTYDSYPYLHESGVTFQDSLPGASPWQTQCPPGTYRTEYDHVGACWPIRAVVDIGKEQQFVKRRTKKW